MVLVLLIALATAALTTVATVIPGFVVAHSSQVGEQAVAQADAGVSDAMFRLDQAGDTVVDFCVGNVPANMLPSDLSDSSCLGHSSSPPLPSAPGLQWYVVSRVSGSLPQGVTDELTITSRASVSGQRRTVTATIYRVADTFAFFTDSGFNVNGALKKAIVYEVSGFGPGSTPLVNGKVDIGVGPNGGAVCNGNSSGTQIVTIGQDGSTIDQSCPTPTQENSNFVAQPPSVCEAGQSTFAFAPCLNTTTFATSAGSSYCPMPGVGIPNTLPTTAALTPPPNAVFDCRTGGNTAVTIGTSSAGSGSTSYPIPFNQTYIPPGTYYFDSNSVTFANVDPNKLVGPVNIFILPAACSGGGCPLSLPTSNGNGCTASGNGSVSLNLTGTYINATSTTSGVGPYTPGDVNNLSVFWSGNSQVTPAGGAVFDGTLYAPAATMTVHGASNAPYLFGPINLDCFTQEGGPHLNLVYPQHANQYLQGWTVTNYRITP